MEAGVKYEFKKEENGFTVVFYRHCGEGWGWSSGLKDDLRDTDPQYDSQAVLQEESLERIIEAAIRENNKVTRAQIAEKAGVSLRTVSRKLRTMHHIRYIGSGYSGYWIIIEDNK